MPGRGLLAVACLVFIALCCISVLRRLDAERRLLRRLAAQASPGARSGAGTSRGARPRGTSTDPGLELDQLTEDEQAVARSLAQAGILTIQSGRCYVQAAAVSGFRHQRLRLACTGGFIALVLAVVVAKLILHR